MKHLVMVGCCAEKRTRLSTAADMYLSQLYRKARAWAERNGDEWVILSAAYGIIRPDTKMMPYDCKMQDLTPEQRQAWDARVGLELELNYWDCRIPLLAGQSYAGWVPSALHQVDQPLAGMGIGRRLQWLTEPQQLSLLESA